MSGRLHVRVYHRKSLSPCACAASLIAGGSGRGAEEEEVTPPPSMGAQEALSAQGQLRPEDMRPWGASLVINRERDGFP